MSVKGIYPTRSKTVIDNTKIQLVSHFSYLGYEMTYEEGNDTAITLR